jgi:hypothetical protein
LFGVSLGPGIHIGMLAGFFFRKQWLVEESNYPGRVFLYRFARIWTLHHVTSPARNRALLGLLKQFCV